MENLDILTKDDSECDRERSWERERDRESDDKKSQAEKSEVPLVGLGDAKSRCTRAVKWLRRKLWQCTRRDATLDEDVGSEEVEDGKFKEHLVCF